MLLMFDKFACRVVRDLFV